jgi:hypothetical protein
MEFLEDEIEDDRFVTPRTFRSAGSKNRTNSHRGSVRSSNSNRSDEFKTVASSSSHILDREDSFRTAQSSSRSFSTLHKPIEESIRHSPNKLQYSAPLSETEDDDSVTELDVSEIFSFARHGRCDDISSLLTR